MDELRFFNTQTSATLERGQDGLRVIQALDFVLPRSLAHVVVLDDEVALGVQFQEVPPSAPQPTASRRFCLEQMHDAQVPRTPESYTSSNDA